MDVCKKREATRKFKSDQIDEEIIRKILEVGRFAPTAKNLQPQRIFVIRSKEGLEKIDQASPCRYHAPTVLLVCSDKKVAWSKGDYSTYEMDACIVATHLMLGATNYGVGNIWIEMFDKDFIKSAFALGENVEPICLIPLGYKAEDDKGNPLHHQRKELEEIVEYL